MARRKEAIRRKTQTAARTGAPPQRSSAALALLAALLPLLFYWHTTDFGFLLDDGVLFAKSESLGRLSSLDDGFRLDVGAVRKGSETPLGGYYRPVFLAASTLYFQAVGGRPAAWHAAAVVLAAAAGLLAYCLFRRLGFESLLALLASLMFSLHPSHVSSIAWASGLQELLAAMFVLLATLALLSRPGPEGETRALALATGAFVLALLSKEVAVALLPVVAAWSFLRRAEDPAESRRLARASAVFGAVVVLYLGLRLAIFGALTRPWPHAPDLATSLASLPLALVTYLRLLLLPFGFSIFRPERPVASPFAPPTLLALVVLAGLGLAAVAVARQRSPRRDLLLPAVWFLAFLLPVLNFWALDPQWMISDRYLFLPALALPWLAVRALPRRAAVAALSIAALLFAGLSWRYSAIFRDEATFFAAMERAEPTSPLVHSEKGRMLLLEGKLTPAEAAYRRAVELAPASAPNLLALGNLELQRGDFASAEVHFRAALDEQPWASRPWKQLAIALAQQGERERAAAVLAESAARWPEDVQLQALHAVALATRGDRAGGERVFAAASSARPDAKDLQGGLDAALARFGPLLAPRRP